MVTPAPVRSLPSVATSAIANVPTQPLTRAPATLAPAVQRIGAAATRSTSLSRDEGRAPATPAAAATPATPGWVDRPPLGGASGGQRERRLVPPGGPSAPRPRLADARGAGQRGRVAPDAPAGGRGARDHAAGIRASGSRGYWDWGHADRARGARDADGCAPGPRGTAHRASGRRVVQPDGLAARRPAQPPARDPPRELDDPRRTVRRRRRRSAVRARRAPARPRPSSG